MLSLHPTELPPRIQRFRMRLMKYSFKMLYVPRKELVIADTLSRAPLEKQLSKEDERRNEDLTLYVSHIVDSFPATERKLDELRLHQQNHEVCRKLFEFCTEAWPDKRKLNTSLKPYWSERATITSTACPKRSSSERSETYHPFISSIRHPGQNSRRTPRNPQIS